MHTWEAEESKLSPDRITKALSQKGRRTRKKERRRKTWRSGRKKRRRWKNIKDIL